MTIAVVTCSEILSVFRFKLGEVEIQIITLKLGIPFNLSQPSFHTSFNEVIFEDRLNELNFTCSQQDWFGHDMYDVWPVVSGSNRRPESLEVTALPTELTTDKKNYIRLLRHCQQLLAGISEEKSGV